MRLTFVSALSALFAVCVGFRDVRVGECVLVDPVKPCQPIHNSARAFSPQMMFAGGVAMAYARVPW